MLYNYTNIYICIYICIDKFIYIYAHGPDLKPNSVNP